MTEPRRTEAGRPPGRFFVGRRGVASAGAAAADHRDRRKAQRRKRVKILVARFFLSEKAGNVL